MARVRQAPDVRVAQIIDTAIRVIAEQGYNGSTLSSLAKHCGLSKAGLFHHFGTKDGLLMAVLEEMDRRNTQVLAPYMKAASRTDQTSTQAGAALRGLLEVMVAMQLNRPELGRLEMTLYNEALSPQHPAHTFFRKREDSALAYFSELLAPWSDMPDSTALQICMVFNGLGIRWLMVGEEFDFHAEWNKVIRMLLPALYAP